MGSSIHKFSAVYCDGDDGVMIADAADDDLYVCLKGCTIQLSNKFYLKYFQYYFRILK